jgi:hypothetical protein
MGVFLAVLCNHNSVLKKLDLDMSSSNVNDTIVPFWLHDLGLGCYSLAATGWMAILAVLCNPY